jgi:GMP synthase (glutamine-hydrolysing)
MSHHDRILIIDFGSQVTQLIARRLRESGVYCEIWPFNAAPEARIRDFAPRGLILSGGPASVLEGESPRAPDAIFDMDLPILGICYGQQTMCLQLGGSVEGHDHREFGRAFVDVEGGKRAHLRHLEQGRPRAGLDEPWRPRDRLPRASRTVASSEGAPFALIADDARHYYGTMFHPEVVHTPHGAQLLRNCTHLVCGCHGDWTMARLPRRGDRAHPRPESAAATWSVAFRAASDSSSRRVLIHEAIGDQLTCIYVDHGLMRAARASRSSPPSATASTSA